MNKELAKAQENLIYGMGQAATFWGYNKLVGGIYGLLYLNDKPLSLEEIAERLEVSKGNISVNIRECERLSMVKKVWVKGDRRDFYEADPNLWTIVRRVTRERQKKEFDFAMNVVKESLLPIEESNGEAKEIKFAKQRLERMTSFFKRVNKIITALISLETLKGAAVQACPVRSRIPKITGKDW